MSILNIIETTIELQDIIKKLKALNLSSEEIEKAYNISIKKDSIEEGIQSKISKASTLIALLLSLSSAGVNGVNDVKQLISNKSTEITQSDTKSIDDIATKVAFLIHPQLVKGDISKFGHVYNLNGSAYSLDLGINSQDYDLLKNIETENSGVLDLAVALAISKDKLLIKKLSIIDADVSKMGNSATKQLRKQINL